MAQPYNGILHSYKKEPSSLWTNMDRSPTRLSSEKRYRTVVYSMLLALIKQRRLKTMY